MVFNIQENKKVKIGEIIFNGNESISDFWLRWQMKKTKATELVFFLEVRI